MDLCELSAQAPVRKQTETDGDRRRQTETDRDGNVPGMYRERSLGMSPSSPRMSPSSPRMSKWICASSLHRHR